MIKNIVRRGVGMKELVKISKLNRVDLPLNILKNFNRYQETKKVVYKSGNQFTMKDDQFIDEWNETKKMEVVQSLIQCIDAGGIVVGAYYDNKLIGFASVEAERFGRDEEYMELSYIHVSNEYRSSGIGKVMFERCCLEAKKIGAKKLYIGAHPAEETQQFYMNIGCTYAQEINKKIYEKEPLDIQLEYHL
jgi:N-acetylglutamate synthase-like GNAT family acetyltransferase